MTSGSRKVSGSALAIVVLVGMLLPLGIAVRAVQVADWDPTILIAFGVDSTSTREYAEERLGDVYLRADQGHDGRFFFIQSNDPWVLNPSEHAAVLDRPLYRSQRMLYPVLAGGFGLLGPQAIIWAMMLVNLVATGLGTWVVARIAMHMGGSPWWGLAFSLNLGFVSEMNISGAGVVSAAAAFAAVLMFIQNRVPSGVFLLTLAVLAREAMLIAVAGVALWLWFDERRKDAVVTAAVPGLAALAWAAYLRLRIETGSVAPEVQEIGWPFVGFFEAFERWVDEPINLAVGVIVMLMFVLFTRRVLMSRHLVGWAFLGFVALGVVFTRQVWHSYFDITRAVAPIITSFVLLVFLGGNGSAATNDGESTRTA